MKVVTFGELMLRLAPNGYYRFFQNDQMQATFGGGEANVAVSLANYGADVAYVTKLPKHAIGQAAVDSLRYFGIDTSKIVRGGDRVGIYFLEKGASQRGSVCIYDRAHSAIQEAKPSDFDWDAIFEGADWFHFTGITPALGENLVEICLEACKAAKAKGVKISCDLNYRGKLWTREQARAAMTKLCEYVDVCISNEEDAKDVFGIEAEGTDITGGKLNHEGYKSVAKQLADKFGFEKVAITLRSSISANDNDWAGMLYDGENYCFSKQYHLHIVDRVGGGDSFGGGLIYALLSGKDTQAAVEFAVAASALKHSIEGDYNRVTVSEVEKLAGGDGSGRVQRYLPFFQSPRNDCCGGISVNTGIPIPSQKGLNEHDPHRLVENTRPLRLPPARFRHPALPEARGKSGVGEGPCGAEKALHGKGGELSRL